MTLWARIWAIVVVGVLAHPGSLVTRAAPAGTHRWPRGWIEIGEASQAGQGGRAGDLRGVDADEPIPDLGFGPAAVL